MQPVVDMDVCGSLLQKMQEDNITMSQGNLHRKELSWLQFRSKTKIEAHIYYIVMFNRF